MEKAEQHIQSEDIHNAILPKWNDIRIADMNELSEIALCLKKI